MKEKIFTPLHLEGKYVVLDEISPKYFPYVIKWRNNPKLNKYLNQPFRLTMELEKKWYEEVYLKDATQDFFIMVDKKTDTPFATLGHTEIDLKNRVCIGGRLLLGNSDYAQHPAFWEGYFLTEDHTYEFVDTEYIHVVYENHKAMRFDKSLGFIPNDGEIKYPNETLVNGMRLQELYRTKDMYLKVRERLFYSMAN